MQTMTDTASPIRHPVDGELVYRFEGRLGGLNPVGIFPEGIRYHNTFEGRVVAGPLAGGRISGIDPFLLRPDGVGVITAPEVIELDDRRLALDVVGYVVPPDGAPAPPLEAVLSPDFPWPDVPFRVTGSAVARTTDPELVHLNSSTIVIEGTIVMATGELVVEARTVPRP